MAKDRQEVEKILGEPVFPEFSDNVLRIRRNLILVSFITLVYKCYDLAISGQIWGLTVDNLDKTVVDEVLFLILLYHVIHFGWATWDHIQEARIRITGMRRIFVAGSDLTEHPIDPRQASLYRWWVDHAPKIGKFVEDWRTLNEKIQQWEKRIEIALRTEDKINLHIVQQSLGEIQNTQSRVRTQLAHHTTAAAKNTPERKTSARLS